MLDFSDQPYRWFPPRRSGLFAWALGHYNRYVYLPRRREIENVRVTGQLDAIRERTSRDRLLFLPNHPTHDDAYIWMEALRQLGVSTHIMAAYDVFLRSQLNAFVMQRMGCFSVDREGSDQQAMKQAIETLTQGHHALTIFPEGNVYLQNDVVTPFHEGAAFLALRGARALAEEKGRVLAVPVSIKVTHVVDVRDPLSHRLHRLAEALASPVKADHPPLEKVKRVGLTALAKNLRHRGHNVPEAPELAELVKQAAETVIARLEAKMELTPGPEDSLIDRIRRARKVVHEIRSDPERAHEHTLAAHWADEAMLAFRIASYSGNYLQARPTIDRFAETIEKLSEDVYARAHPPVGRREALVHFGEPIDLTEHLEARPRQAAQAVTAAAEQAVQRGLDQLNAENDRVGARLWE